MSENKSKKYISNIVFDFLVLKFLNIHTREGRVVSFMNIVWQVSYVNWRWIQMVQLKVVLVWLSMKGNLGWNFIPIGLKHRNSHHHLVSNFKRVIRLCDLLASAPSHLSYNRMGLSYPYSKHIGSLFLGFCFWKILIVVYII